MLALTLSLLLRLSCSPAMRMMYDEDGDDVNDDDVAADVCC